MILGNISNYNHTTRCDEVVLVLGCGDSWVVTQLSAGQLLWNLGLVRWIRRVVCLALM